MAKIFVSFSVVSTSNVILVARELDNLTAEVFRQFYAAPHTQRNLTIDDLNAVMHRIQVWTTTNGTTLGSLLGSCDIDASITDNTAFSIFSFVVDGAAVGSPSFDPPSGQGQYPNAELIGKTYTVFKAGYGPLIWGTHIQELAGGGFEFIDGQEFSPAEEYTLMVSNIIQTHITESGKGYPGDVVDVTASIDFTSTHYNKLLEVNAAVNVVITITSIVAIPNGTVFGINTHNGTQVNVTLQLPVGAYCQIEGHQRNAIYIGRGETVNFIKKGAYLRIVSWDGDYKRVGDIVKKDGIAPLNSLPSTGGWYLISTYLRAFHWYVDELPVDEFFNDPSETTPLAVNKGYWGKGTTKFWVPDTRDMFERQTDGTRKSGNFQDQEVGPHYHDVGTQNVATTPAYNLGANHPVRSWSATPQIDSNQKSSTALNTGSETRPKNIARNVYRII